MNSRAGTTLAPPPPPGGGRGVSLRDTPLYYPLQVLVKLFCTIFFFDFFRENLLTDADFSDRLFPMKTQSMTATLDNISLRSLGRARSLAIAGRSCVTCGKRADIFRDSLSVKEYNISGMCQKCQDEVFVENEE